MRMYPSNDNKCILFNKYYYQKKAMPINKKSEHTLIPTSNWRPSPYNRCTVSCQNRNSQTFLLNREKTYICLVQEI